MVLCVLHETRPYLKTVIAVEEQIVVMLRTIAAKRFCCIRIDFLLSVASMSL